MLSRTSNYSAPEMNAILVNTTATVWQQLTTNSTDVFLHALLVRSDLAAANKVLDKKAFSRGEALHGVVRMVKHDKIPRHFRQRYLLSDFGLVNISAVEGKF